MGDRVDREAAQSVRYWPTPKAEQELRGKQPSDQEAIPPNADYRAVLTLKVEIFTSSRNLWRTIRAFEREVQLTQGRLARVTFAGARECELGEDEWWNRDRPEVNVP